MGASARNRGHRGERARNSHRYTTEPLMPPKAILSAEWDQPPSHPSLTCTHIHVHSAPSFFFSRASRRVFVAALVIRTFSDWRRACDTYARWVEKERRKEGERERQIRNFDGAVGASTPRRLNVYMRGFVIENKIRPLKVQSFARMGISIHIRTQFCGMRYAFCWAFFLFTSTRIRGFTLPLIDVGSLFISNIFFFQLSFYEFSIYWI